MRFLLAKITLLEPQPNVSTMALLTPSDVLHIGPFPAGDSGLLLLIVSDEKPQVYSDKVKCPVAQL